MKQNKGLMLIKDLSNVIYQMPLQVVHQIEGRFLHIQNEYQQMGKWFHGILQKHSYILCMEILSQYKHYMLWLLIRTSIRTL